MKLSLNGLHWGSGAAVVGALVLEYLRTQSTVPMDWKGWAGLASGFVGFVCLAHARSIWAEGTAK